MTVQFGVDTICGPCKGSGVSHERECLKCSGNGFLHGGVAVARRSDPATSRAAAASISSERLRASQVYVLHVIKTLGPMTDERLVQAVTPELSPSGARTRRHELEVMGKVVDSGRRERTVSGRQSTVWQAAE